MSSSSALAPGDPPLPTPPRRAGRGRAARGATRRGRGARRRRRRDRWRTRRRALRSGRGGDEGLGVLMRDELVALGVLEEARGPGAADPRHAVERGEGGAVAVARARQPELRDPAVPPISTAARTRGSAPASWPPTFAPGCGRRSRAVRR